LNDATGVLMKGYGSCAHATEPSVSTSARANKFFMGGLPHFVVTSITDRIVQNFLPAQSLKRLVQ
jgi:hypothetical protein